MGILRLKDTNKDKFKTECFICKCNKDIAEEHYIVPLYEVKKIIIEQYDNEVICLCPNCHSFLHLYLTGKPEKISSAIDYFNTEEMKKRLIQISTRYHYLKAKNVRCGNANR